MYKLWTRLLFVTGVTVGVFSASAAWGASPLRTFLDGRELAFDVPPVIVEGRTLVPVRGLLSAMGAEVTWDAPAAQVGVVLGDVHIRLTIGAATALVGDAAVPLDVPPRINEGRTLIPLRFVSETLGARVAWDEATQTINITSRGGSTPARGDRTTPLVVADGPLRLRSGPGTRHAIITELPTGTRVEASVQESGWWRVKTAAGAVGWVAAEFVAPAAAPQPPGAGTSALVQLAMKLLGAPYAYGGTTPDGFDCSGYTSYVFRQVGVELPRTAAEQAALGQAVALADLRPGDLLFWNTDGNGISHVGIYVGDDKFIHAENDDTGVVLTPVSKPWWSARYAGARRVLP